MKSIIEGGRGKGFPRLVIQLPIPNGIPMPGAFFIPIPKTANIWKQTIHFALQVGGGRAQSGRVVGFALQKTAESPVMQFIRQDYGHDHGKASTAQEETWPDATAGYDIHYHVQKYQ